MSVDFQFSGSALRIDRGGFVRHGGVERHPLFGQVFLGNVLALWLQSSFLVRCPEKHLGRRGETGGGDGCWVFCQFFIAPKYTFWHWGPVYICFRILLRSVKSNSHSQWPLRNLRFPALFACFRGTSFQSHHGAICWNRHTMVASPPHEAPALELGHRSSRSNISSRF